MCLAGLKPDRLPIIHITTAAAGMNSTTSLLARVPRPIATPVNAAARNLGAATQVSRAHNASEIIRQLTLSDITRPSLTHRFG